MRYLAPNKCVSQEGVSLDKINRVWGERVVLRMLGGGAPWGEARQVQGLGCKINNMHVIQL